MTEAIEAMPPGQTTFVCFRQIPPKNRFPMAAYHGQDSVDGYLLLGRYKADEVTTPVRFKELPTFTQEYFVEYNFRRYGDRADDKYYRDNSFPDFDKGNYSTNHFIADLRKSARSPKSQRVMVSDVVSRVASGGVASGGVASLCGHGSKF